MGSRTEFRAPAWDLAGAGTPGCVKGEGFFPHCVMGREAEAGGLLGLALRQQAVSQLRLKMDFVLLPICYDSYIQMKGFGRWHIDMETRGPRFIYVSVFLLS